ncbi:MAG: IgGFc-binding protein, partial [Candidatus Kapaibacterium sp.]
MRSVRFPVHPLLFLLFLFLASLTGHAQVPAGREFIVVLPGVSQGEQRNLNIGAFSIEVMAQRDANVKVAWANDGTTIVNTFIVAGTRAYIGKQQLAIWQIMQRPEIENAEVINKIGLIVTADQPVSVRATFDSANCSETYTVFPVSSYGLAYTLATYNSMAQTSQKNGFVVMASQDNTQVNITPTVVTWKTEHPAGTPFTVTLNKYQMIQVVSSLPGKADGDLTGTLIKADKPIGVVSFSQAAGIPYTGPHDTATINTCQFLTGPYFSTKPIIEQQGPNSSAGTTFYTMPFYRTTTSAIELLMHCKPPPNSVQTYMLPRRDTSLLRFVTVTDGTTYDTNGVRIGKKSGIGDSIFNAGMVFDFPIVDPIKVEASKPVIGMELEYSGIDRMSYGPMPTTEGERADSIRVPYGDPMMVYLPPVSSYRTDLEITTPNFRERPSKTNIQRLTVNWRHLLIVTAPVSAVGKVLLNGQPITFDYPHKDGKYISAMVRVGPAQRQLIESPEPVTMLGYGMTWNDSYGTASSEAVRSHGVVMPDTLRFFSCTTQSDTSITVQNVGSGDFKIDSIRFNGINGSVLNPTPAEFPKTVVAFSSRKVLIRVKTPTPGVYTGSIRVYTDANNKAVYELPFVITRDSAQLAIPATTVDFGVL